MSSYTLPRASCARKTVATANYNAKPTPNSQSPSIWAVALNRICNKAAPNDVNAPLRSPAVHCGHGAFSIFARRRRPQVSAQNQTMRFGEINKILAGEWNAMGVAEKQAYISQAVQLRRRSAFTSKL